MFLEDGRSVHAIANQLNRQGIPYGESRWTHHTVQQILSHPKYAGCNVFGRTSQKLGTPSVRIPQSDWVLTPRAFQPVVSEEVHKKAIQVLLNRTINKSDVELLEFLRQLLVIHGRLSLQLIKRCPQMASPSTYRKRFGSLRRAYQLIGYGRPSDFGPIDLRRRTQAIREGILRDIGAAFPDRVTIVRQGGRWRSYLRLKNGRIVTVLIARSIKAKVPIWQADPVRRECRRVTLLALLNEDNTSVREMRFFKCMRRNRRFHVKESDPWLRSGMRLPTVLDFCESVRRLVNRN
jgi:hypothetical protein